MLGGILSALLGLSGVGALLVTTIVAVALSRK
jgi:hypothetical protein